MGRLVARVNKWVYGISLVAAIGICAEALHSRDAMMGVFGGVFLFASFGWLLDEWEKK